MAGAPGVEVPVRAHGNRRVNRHRRSGEDRTSLDFKGFSRALEQRKELVKEPQRRFDDYDFIISPVATGPAFAHNPKHAPIELDGRTISYLDYAMPFVTSYNACGNPALVIPQDAAAAACPSGCRSQHRTTRRTSLFTSGRWWSVSARRSRHHEGTSDPEAWALRLSTTD